MKNLINKKRKAISYIKKAKTALARIDEAIELKKHPRKKLTAGKKVLQEGSSSELPSGHTLVAEKISSSLYEFDYFVPISNVIFYTDLTSIIKGLWNNSVKGNVVFKKLNELGVILQVVYTRSNLRGTSSGTIEFGWKLQSKFIKILTDEQEDELKKYLAPYSGKVL